MDGPLWLSNRCLALTLAASFPSGDARVVRLRARIGELAGGFSGGWSSIVASVPPLVSSVLSVPRPWPADAVYVGHGPADSGFAASPWGSPYADPLVSSCCADDRFERYAASRADRIGWLAPLCNKRLLCHCGTAECHAHILAKLIMDTFTIDAPQTPAFINAVCGNCDVVAGIVAYNSSCSADVSRWRISLDAGRPKWPCAAPWPEEWTLMVESIRANQCGLVWEICAGGGGGGAFDKILLDAWLDFCPPCRRHDLPLVQCA